MVLFWCRKKKKNKNNYSFEILLVRNNSGTLGTDDSKIHDPLLRWILSSGQAVIARCVSSAFCASYLAVAALKRFPDITKRNE